MLIETESGPKSPTHIFNKLFCYAECRDSEWTTNNKKFFGKTWYVWDQNNDFYKIRNSVFEKRAKKCINPKEPSGIAPN
jgi:hypothetical protein